MNKKFSPYNSIHCFLHYMLPNSLWCSKIRPIFCLKVKESKFRHILAFMQCDSIFIFIHNLTKLCIQVKSIVEWRDFYSRTYKWVFFSAINYIVGSRNSEPLILHLIGRLLWWPLQAFLVEWLITSIRHVYSGFTIYSTLSIPESRIYV